MNFIGWLFTIVAGVLSYLIYRRNPSLVLQGWKNGFTLLIKIFPVLLLAFAISGLVQIMVPKGTRP